ncbi:Protein of unknown function [Mucilaginibacter gossypiicola]|uniref:DUF3095 domain-containing protein n=1 Tax=Mucilaginibacter gossypiicola TaxID=551995 RepID=A0A1H8S0B2_9SPHI|nr:DUF3095 domain-containing protein [Mucilaginibacter gossypiicola]SEO72110.1 Protein of unknown function [Mucilaginibacter gossypiicola]
MPAIDQNFYSDLKVNTIPLGELFIKEELFDNVPADWHIIITDIKGSTFAVSSGQHENLNFVATGSIVSVLNIAFKHHITVPFFFGGDGATFIVPAPIVDTVMQALVLYKDNTRKNFDLELRTGIVPVKQVYDEGYKLCISKYCTTGNFTIPVVLGNGLSYAEKMIKGREDEPFDYMAQEGELDLTGMQCRWDKIPPPQNADEVVSLLVVAREENKQAEVFKKVICYIDEIYGGPEKRQPISVPKLKLKSTFDRLGREMKVKLGKIKVMELLKEWMVMLYGYIYFNTKEGKHYLNRLVEMSDTLVIDGKINTVISGTSAQRKKLQEVLTKLEKDGELYFGFHVSRESVMSCYVRDLEDGHIHFVDGSEGGYTKAAGFIKNKLATV